MHSKRDDLCVPCMESVVQLVGLHVTMLKKHLIKLLQKRTCIHNNIRNRPRHIRIRFYGVNNREIVSFNDNLLIWSEIAHF